MMDDLHLSRYERHLWRAPDLLVVRGDFSEALVSRDAYEARHGIAPTGGAPGQALERLMAAAGLAAVSLAERESWGWSITLPGADFGLFCGVEPEGLVCGRVREAERAAALGVLQRQHGNGPVFQSNFEPRGPDPVSAVTTYFDQVEQRATRLALRGASEGVLVQALPGGAFESVSGLDDAALFAAVAAAIDGGATKLLDEVVLFYECRCDDGMIDKMLASLSDKQRAYLWEDQTALSIECPRCGRDFQVAR